MKYAFFLIFCTPLLQGCIVDLLEDEFAPDLPGQRAGMVIVGETPSFVFHAREGTIHPGAGGLKNDMVWLEHARRHYQALFRDLSREKVHVYLHEQGSFDYSGSGIAWCDDHSFDIIDWDPDCDGCCSNVEAHELAHLAACDWFGIQANVRPFLSEGMASYLAYSVPDPETGIPDTPFTGFWACDDSWAITDYFAGADWFDDNRKAPAALFTYVAVQRVMLKRYFYEFYLPSDYGTTAKADARLKKVVGLSFAEMEREIRRFDSVMSPVSCSSGNPCPGACRCRPKNAGGPDGLCVPSGL